MTGFESSVNISEPAPFCMRRKCQRGWWRWNLEEGNCVVVVVVVVVRRRRRHRHRDSGLCRRCSIWPPISNREWKQRVRRGEGRIAAVVRCNFWFRWKRWAFAFPVAWCQTRRLFIKQSSFLARPTAARESLERTAKLVHYSRRNTTCFTH